MDNPDFERNLTNRRDTQPNLSASVDTTKDRQEKPAVDETHLGKKVFSPNELNQSGEDKEYFHPKNGHKLVVPKDANDHAVTPDIEMSPGSNKLETKR